MVSVEKTAGPNTVNAPEEEELVRAESSPVVPFVRWATTLLDILCAPTNVGGEGVSHVELANWVTL